MQDFITHINWVDIFIIGVLFRVCYIARERGFIFEVFKLLGTIFGLYLSLHYYSSFSDLLRNQVGITFVPLEFLDFVCFILLSCIGCGIFWILREVTVKVVKVEAIPTLARWGGVVLGIVRAVLMVSLIIFALVISSISYLKKSAVQSYMGQSLFTVAPAVYSGLWDGVMSKFMTQETYNQAIREVGDNLEDFESVDPKPSVQGAEQ